MTVDPSLVRDAIEHVRSIDLHVEPRKQWPPNAGRDGFHGKIPEDRRLERGRVLSVYGDGGWGDLVRRGKWKTGSFDEQLVAASADLIAKRWHPDPFPAG